VQASKNHGSSRTRVRTLETLYSRKRPKHPNIYRLKNPQIYVGRGRLKDVQGLWWKERMKIASWDLIPGIDAVARAANASWFEWDDGSRPFHWRWPEFYQKVIRDGLKVHFTAKKPQFKRPQAENKCPKMMQKMREKLDKVRKRRYIPAPGFVLSSLTCPFLLCLKEMTTLEWYTTPRSAA
jgi:hypothetical protein